MLPRNVVRTFPIIASKISFDPEPVCSSSSSPSSESSLNKLCTAQASSYSLRSDGDNSNAFFSASSHEPGVRALIVIFRFFGHHVPRDSA